MSRDEAIEVTLRALALGTMTMPAALGAMWDAGRKAERLDSLRMEQAQREAKALRSSGTGQRKGGTR